jgi:hypothetical protein
MCCCSKALTMHSIYVSIYLSIFVYLFLLLFVVVVVVVADDDDDGSPLLPRIDLLTLKHSIDGMCMSAVW